jgi:hypothetical protein
MSDSAGGFAPSLTRPADLRDSASRGPSSGSGEALRVFESNCEPGRVSRGGSKAVSGRAAV